MLNLNVVSSPWIVTSPEVLWHRPGKWVTFSIYKYTLFIFFIIHNTLNLNFKGPKWTRKLRHFKNFWELMGDRQNRFSLLIDRFWVHSCYKMAIFIEFVPFLSIRVLRGGVIREGAVRGVSNALSLNFFWKHVIFMVLNGHQGVFL